MTSGTGWWHRRGHGASGFRLTHRLGNLGYMRRAAVRESCAVLPRPAIGKRYPYLRGRIEVAALAVSLADHVSTSRLRSKKRPPPVLRNCGGGGTRCREHFKSVSVSPRLRAQIPFSVGQLPSNAPGGIYRRCNLMRIPRPPRHGCRFVCSHLGGWGGGSVAQLQKERCWNHIQHRKVCSSHRFPALIRLQLPQTWSSAYWRGVIPPILFEHAVKWYRLTCTSSPRGATLLDGRDLFV